MRAKDPYEVLGISRSASEKEIKEAYKRLVKQYHPDQYQDNPLSDIAEEKMGEINAAYDEIIEERRSGGYTYRAAGDTTGYSNGAIDYTAIRNMIAMGNVTAAERELDSVLPNDRSAEWFFLKGNIAYSRGWVNEAYNEFAEACRLDPYNAEYNAAFNRLNSQGSGYMPGRQSRYNSGNTANDTLNCLGDLCLLDCCCECMGGDLIPCC